MMPRLAKPSGLLVQTIPAVPKTGGFRFIYRSGPSGGEVGIAGFKGRMWLWTCITVDEDWVEVEDDWK